MRLACFAVAVLLTGCGRTELGDEMPALKMPGLKDPVRVVCTAQTCGRALTVGLSHGCALVNQAAWCWGRNSEAQLGFAPDMEAHEARAVPTSLRFTAIVAAEFHTCGLTESGEVHCWGGNRFGQLGDGSLNQPMAASSATPVEIPGVPRAVSLEVGEVKTCALTAAEERWCWGGFSGRNPPKRVAAPSRDAIMLLHACQLAGGAVQCWGSNTVGQIGPGADELTRLTAVSGLPGGVTQVVTPMLGSCVLAGGEVWCWGQWDGMSNQPAAAVAGFKDVTTLRNGFIHVCGLTKAGRVGCVLSSGARTADFFAFDDIEDFTAGGWSGCVRRANREVWCKSTSSTGSVLDLERVATLPASN